MHNFYSYLLFIFLIHWSITSFSQNGMDSLVLTGTIKDTVIARRLFDSSVDFYKKTKLKDALIQADSAIFIWKKYLQNECVEIADIYHLKGNILDDQGNIVDALLFYQKALDIRRKIYPDDKNPAIANSLNNIALLYIKTDDLEKALNYLQSTISIRTNLFGLLSKQVSEANVNIGIVFKSKGDYEKSIEYYKKALDFYKNTNTTNEAILYNNIGNVYRILGDNDKSIDYQLAASSIFRKKLGEDHPYFAWSLNNISISYDLKNNHEKAIEFGCNALKIRKKILPSNHPDIAASFLNIGSYYDSMGKEDSSIYYLNLALDIYKASEGISKSKIANCLNNLGLIYNRKGDCALGASFHSAALSLRQSVFGADHPDVALSLKNVAISEKCFGHYNRADSLFDQALIALRYLKSIDVSSVTSIPLLLEILLAKSDCERTHYTTHLDVQYLAQSQETVNEIIKILSGQSKASFQTYPEYEFAAYNRSISNSLLLHNQINDKQFLLTDFSFTEAAKANKLRTALEESNALSFSGIPDSLLQREHTLRINLTWREKQRQSLLDNGLSETDTNTLRISSIIFDLKNDYEALKKRFETQYPDYYRLKYDLSTVSLQYVQDTLLKPKNQALLEYFVGDSSIYLFIVRPDTLIVQEVKRDFPLEYWIEQFRQGIYGFYTARKADQTDALFDKCLEQYLEYAPKLYEKLFASVKAFLPEQVILVPDGPLGYVPFDALLTAAPKDPNDFKKYPYLLNKHQFSYTYSATLLKEMRDKQHHHKPTKEFVAFAPFYDGDTTLLANMYQYDDLMRKDMQPLAYSGEEVAAASKMMNGEIVAGAAATEERFTQMAGDYRILHLATHGRADNRVGDYAFLAFTEIKDSIENELLYVKDLYNLELNADLVVLSACETGIGKLQRGEGIISLARAFAYAGAKSIITTLWEVNDKSTSEQMRYFYRELKRGKTKDEALRLARKRYFNEQSVDVCHPFFWAAFVPVGDMRAVR